MLSIYGASVSEVADGTEARSQFFNKSALFTEHSNADNIRKRRTVADSVGESGDLDLGASVASLGVNTRP